MIIRVAIVTLALFAVLGADCEKVTNLSTHSSPSAAYVCAHDDVLSSKDIETIQKIKSVLVASENYLDIEYETFVPKPAHMWSTGQRILLIDHGMHALAYTRYKQRVLDFLDFDEHGALTTSTHALKMHRGRRIIFSEIIGNDHPYIPARKINDLNLSAEISQKFPATDLVGHGTPIFGILAEHNPKAEFVISQLPNLVAWPFKDHFCSPSTESLSRISSLFESASNALLAAIHRHDLNFIQYAENATFDAFNGQFVETCKSIAYDQRADWIRHVQRAHLKHFVKPLTHIPEVILVQAGASSNYKLNKGDKNFWMDCASFQNRLRVGALNKVTPGLPIEGTNRIDLLPPNQRNAEACVDLFVNSGVNYEWPKFDALLDWQAAPHAIKFSDDGLTEVAYTGLKPSWAAPVALSYLIYLKNTLPPGTTAKELLAHANNNGSGKIKDPAFFAQFEKCHYKQ